MFSGVPREVGFTPFVGALRAEARRRVGELLGVEEGGEFSWHLRDREKAAGEPGEALDVLLRVGSDEAPALELDLSPARDGARAWFSGTSVHLSYRRGRDGSDPFEDPALWPRLESLRARLEAWEREGPGGPLDALARALRDDARFREVEDYMYRQSRPRELIIRLGFRCNQDCHFCWQGRSWPEPPAELFRTWLDEAAAAGHPAVHFSGGEPTIHRSLPDLVRRARRDHGMMVWVQTNAIRMAKESYLRELVDAGLNGVFVSYHSADPEVSDRMTRAPRTHGVTVRGVERCLAAGVKVELNAVVERENAAGLADHARDVVERFVRPFPRNPVSRVSYSHPSEYYDRDVYDRSAVPLDDVRAPLSAAVAILLEAGVAVEGLGTCGFPPCLLRDRPALLRALVPAEEHEMDASARAFAPSCDRCAVRRRCLGVRREYLDRFADRGLVPFVSSPF